MCIRDSFTSVYNLDDPSIQLNEGYQQVQGRISIGSGQLTGKGLFNGPRVETNLVTFQHSDFIFSVAGEELGFIGCTADVYKRQTTYSTLICKMTCGIDHKIARST